MAVAELDIVLDTDVVNEFDPVGVSEEELDVLGVVVEILEDDTVVLDETV